MTGSFIRRACKGYAKVFQNRFTSLPFEWNPITKSLQAVRNKHQQILLWYFHIIVILFLVGTHSCLLVVLKHLYARDFVLQIPTVIVIINGFLYFIGWAMLVLAMTIRFIQVALIGWNHLESMDTALRERKTHNQIMAR
jgi:hypothetical protein